MSLISKREQNFLSDWAKSAESRMAKEQVHTESYFEDRTDEKNYLVEYVFDTATDLDKMIKQILGDKMDDTLRKVCEIAACKEENRRSEKEEKEAETSIIPEFIYNF